MQNTGGGALAAPPTKNDELVPNLNNYVRGKLSKSEVLSFADCARALAEALITADGSTKELIARVLNRMTLFGSLPPSILPMLVSVRVKVDLPKTADRKLLRVVNYLIQLAAGEGSAGTVVPFSTLVGQSLPPSATDVFDYNALDPVWADVKSETVTHYQRAAAFRALAALARSSLSSDPDDLTLVSHLMAAVATTLDRCEAARRRKLPFGIGGGSKKVREMDRRQTLERVAAQRAALSASRAGLPSFVLSSKIAPRAFGGVNSPDPACARHALAVAALAARDMPGMYVEQMGQFVMNTLEIYTKTGSLGGAEQAAAMAAAAAEGMPAPLRPTKEVYQEKSLNLADDWARLYLARGCGAVVHAGVGNSAPFWEMLALLACCDKSIIVALEAIRALAGAPYPTAAAAISTTAAANGNGAAAAGSRRVLLPDEHVEADARLRYSMAWNLLIAHADDDAPGGAAAAAGAAAGATGGFGRQFTISRTQRAVQESASLRRLASLGSEAAPGRAAAGETGATTSSTGTARRSLFSAVVSRLLTCLGLMSHAAICSATRVVAVLAEARAHALAAARTPADRAAVLGDEEVQHLMEQLEHRMLAIASDSGFSAHQREKALEALLWFSQLPPSRSASPLLTPRQIAQWISSGGGTVSLAVRAIFADPWPEDVVSSFMLALSRRLLSAPAAASFLLSCATAVASAAPSRVKQEQLHAMWDVCLRANVPAIKLACLQAALSIMCAPAPAIAAPPSAAAPEVKALASREEAAMVALSRSAAWWLGENANFGTGEYAWKQRALQDELSKQLESADGASQQQLAAAAVVINPVLAMLIARLQRVMVMGLWEVRIAAAQAVAKIAVRSGEPFRIQCYSILAAAAAGSIAHRSRSSSRGGSAAAAATAGGSTGNGADVAAAASAAMQGAAADPLGVAVAAGPALEVLDHIYAGELVVDQLIIRYGARRSKWPKKLLRTLEKRNAALVAAISERLCYVPKEHFWPLGNAAKELITGKEEDDEETKARKKREKEEKAAAERAEAEANGKAEQPPEKPADETERRRRYDSSEEESPRAADRQANMLDKLQGYDYDPNAPHEDLEYPDDSVSQIDHTDDEHYRETGAGSDDDSDILLHRGVALYDFSPEEEDEVAISKGETVDIEYEVGGWLQIIRSDGSRGLVPKSYVLIKEDEDTSDAFSLGRSSSAVAQQTQAEGAADYNNFLGRASMRLRPRTSQADSETSSTAPYGSLRQRQQSLRRRESIEEVDTEPVDVMAMSRMVAQVAQQGGEVDRALEQVDELERVTRSGGTFNQPQYLHLKEALNAVINSLDQLKVSGDARNMRRQMVDRAIAGLDKLENMRRYAMGGVSTTATGGSPGPGAAASLAAELPAYSDAAAAGETAGGGAADEDYQYVPTKVRAVYAFDAEAEGELSVAVGDSLWVETEVDGWYQVVRDGDGARGLVPSSYVDVEQF